MEIIDVFTVDNLTTKSVSVKKQKILVDGDCTYQLGEPTRTAYIKDSLEELRENVPEPYLSAITDVWGVTKDTEE